MHQLERRSLKKSLSELQSNYQAQMDRKTICYGVRRFAKDLGPKPKTCQWIEGEPKDRMFCDKPVHGQYSWCAHHLNRVSRIPLTAEE